MGKLFGENLSNNVLEHLKSIVKSVHKGNWFRQNSIKNGAEIWAPVDATGSMMIAKTGHAGFDEHCADYITMFDPILMDLFLQLAEASEKLVETDFYVTNENARQIEEARSEVRRCLWEIRRRATVKKEMIAKGETQVRKNTTFD